MVVLQNVEMDVFTDYKVAPWNSPQFAFELHGHDVGTAKRSISLLLWYGALTCSSHASGYLGLEFYHVFYPFTTFTEASPNWSPNTRLLAYRRTSFSLTD